MRRALATSLAAWRFQAGALGGVTVAQRVHRVIRFVHPGDSVDAVRFDPVANARRPQWMARSDGLVEWTTTFDRSVREVSTAADVLTWVAEFSTLRRRATPPLDRVSPGLPTRYFRPARATPWLAMLGRRDGARLAAGLYRSATTDSAIGVMVHAPCGSMLNAYIPDHLEPDSVLRRAETVARAALAMYPAARIDTTRVYGELEVTCPARPARAPEGEAVILDSLRHALVLSREAAVAFVITRDGAVDRRTIHVFGDRSGTERERILAAVAALRFIPGRFAGYPVAQRRHLIIGVPDPTGPGSLDAVRDLCVESHGLGVRLRALVPARGIPQRDLAEIGHRLIGGVAQATAIRPLRGSVRFVAMPEGNLAFVRWLSPPPDTAEAVRELRNLTYLQVGLVGRLNSQPHGVEATFAGGCG
jgi:hypothetical protein